MLSPLHRFAPDIKALPPVPRREEGRNRPELTGFPAQDEHYGEGPGARSPAPLSAAWMTDELIEDTRRIWSNAYGRVVTVEEAMEILMNVRGLALTMVKAQREGQAE